MSEFSTWGNIVDNPRVRVPFVAGIFKQIKQGDSATWTDEPFFDSNDVGYDSSGYTLKYTIAGPIAAPLVLTAVANGLGWKTTLTTVQSAALAAGIYSWQVQAFATGIRITVDEGELTAEADLALVGANYDGRSQAEIALAQAKAAYASFSSTSGRVKAYTIGHRSMTFDTIEEVRAQVNFWKGEVEKEKMIANPRRRMIFTRLDRIR